MGIATGKFENTDTIRVENGWLITDTARYNLTEVCLIRALPAYGYQWVKDHWLVVLHLKPDPHAQSIYTIKTFEGEDAETKAVELYNEINKKIAQDCAMWWTMKGLCD